MGSEILIYGGINQIGGNKILIKDSGESLFFDFGISYSDKGRYFAEFLEPRNVKGIGDYLDFKLIPNIPCLYRDDLCKPINYPTGDSPIKAVFISHAHMDHCGFIPFLKEEIPIYSSDITNKIIESYETVSKGGIDKEFVNIKKRPYGKNVHHTHWEKKERNYLSWQKFNGQIDVKFYSVDHSTWGAGIYQIKTSDRNIVYTGDLRLHGIRNEETTRSLERLKNQEIDVLIIEGTNLGNELEEKSTNDLINLIMKKSLGKKLESEENLRKEVLKIVQTTKKPIFVSFSIRDFDRFITFFEVAKESDRKFVIPVKLAKHIIDLGEFLGIRINDESLMIYQEPKKLGSYELGEYSIWERLVYDRPNVIKFRDIKENLGKYLIFIDYYHLKNLIDIKPKRGIYIHSASEPFSEEMAVDFRRHLEWIKFFNLEYHYLHTSGHLSEEEIFTVINELNPKVIVPIHTIGARKLKKKFENVVIPRLNKAM